MSNVPTITEEQRAEALARAVQARRERAAWKSRLKRGEATLGDALASTDPAVLGMPVSALLRSLPGIGSAKAEAIMAGLRIIPGRRVRGLGRRQREALLAAVGGRG